jgi:ABC-2 type transport system permease protein
MKKIRLVAKREFLTTVGNKGFMIGLLIMPALGFILLQLIPRIANAPAPQIRGEVAVIDATSQVTAELRTELDPQTIRARRREEALRTMVEAARGIGQAAPQVAAAELSGAAAQVPDLRLVERPVDADIQKEKEWLKVTSPNENHLALIVLHPDAVVRASGRNEFGSYDLYVSANLNDNTESVIYESLRRSLVSARLRASNLDQTAVESTMRVARPRSVVVATKGEQQTQRGFKRALPFILGLLMFMGVMIGGQTLMTSTIEEKSSRVVEVLLAAISPLELMAGKLLGQLAVGLIVMSVYISLGIYALSTFSMLNALEPMLVLYLIVFFIITYAVFGAFMLSIGAAVNQIADAQSLMGPVMLLLILPYILSPIVGQAPNSTFSVAISFIPPVNTFFMMARLASDSPPPSWQVWLTVLVGIGAACSTVWFAAKVFKVGLLMHGKPPNFATLIRWARQA